jgi:hypothetical protein
LLPNTRRFCRTQAALRAGAPRQPRQRATLRPAAEKTTEHIPFTLFLQIKLQEFELKIFFLVWLALKPWSEKGLKNYTAG